MERQEEKTGKKRLWKEPQEEGEKQKKSFFELIVGAGPEAEG